MSSPSEDAARARLRPRPYVLTGGRTEPALPLTDETLVQAACEPSATSKVGVTYAMHRQVVVDYCQEVRTVAAIAEYFQLPTLVAEVVVADLIVVGLLETLLSPTDRPDLRLLEKVLEGLS